MDRILFVDACVRPRSRTRRLAEVALRQLSGQVEEVRLARERIAPLDNDALEERTRLVEAEQLDAPALRWAKQFSEADEILIAAPYWDMAFPACLKAYLEAVTVAGITFRYDERGIPVGLCRARRLIYVATSGGPVIGENMGYSYVAALARNFYGIPALNYFDAQGLDILGADVESILLASGRQCRQGLQPPADATERQTSDPID